MFHTYEDKIHCANYFANTLNLFALLIISIIYVGITRESFKIKKKIGD